MTFLFRRIICVCIVAVLAACSSGGPQGGATAVLPATSAQNARTPFAARPQAIDAYLVFTTGGALGTGSCYGSPTGVSEDPVETVSFAFQTVAVGYTNTCNNSPGGFTATNPLSTKGSTASLTAKGCFPYAVNDKGEAVGGTGASAGRITQAAYLKGAQCVALPNLTGDSESNAYAINDAGTIVGYSEQCGCGAMKHPVEWIDHKVIALSWGLGEAVGINKHGLIIGSVYDSKGNPTAAIWSGPNHVNLIGNLVPGTHLYGGQINDLGHATMYGSSGTYFYNGTTATKITQTLPGDGPFTPLGLDDQDNIYGISSTVGSRVVGKVHPASTTSHLVVDSGGTVTNMQTLVPPNVTLLPGVVTPGYGGSGLTVSGGTGIVVTPAQERIDNVAGKPGMGSHSRVQTETVFLIPPGCAPFVVRRR